MKGKTLETVLSGLSDKNIKFEDLRNFVKSLGFRERIRGDHYIFSKTGILEIVNLQPLRGGKAKSYQVKQVRNIVLRYKLHEETGNAQV